MEAYNRLSLLLEQQKTPPPELESYDPSQSENHKKGSCVIENKIDILTNIMALDFTKDAQNSQNQQINFSVLNESHRSSGARQLFRDDKIEIEGNEGKSLTSKNILPHVDDLITFLVNNNIASSAQDQTAYFISPTEPLAKENSRKQAKVYTMKKSNYDPFAVFKVNLIFQCIVIFSQESTPRRL
jgi:hypothetical protein